MRMPLPPPPAAALMITGYPIASAMRAASSASAMASVVPGAIGTPASSMMARAAVLSPIARMASGGGPMKTMPARAQASAKSAFSERNP